MSAKDAAIHGDGLCGNVAGAIRQQETGRFSQLLGSADMSHRHASAEQLAAGGGATPHDVLVAAGGVLLLLVACTVARTGLMALFAGRRA